MDFNKVRVFLVVARKLQSYHCKLGPYDAIKLVIQEDGNCQLYVYDHILEEGSITFANDRSVLSSTFLSGLLNKLADQSWTVCPGIPEYSAFQVSIGYDCKQVVVMNMPPDSAACPMFYLKSGGKSRETDSCQKCTSLKWYLQKRKRARDDITPDVKEQWQSCHSKVRFDYLSPTSKRLRLKNMSLSIRKLQARAEYYKEVVERSSISDVQNEEIGELVDAVIASSECRKKLDEIYSEAEAVHEGLGKTVESIWNKDVDDWKQFLTEMVYLYDGACMWLHGTDDLTINFFS